MGSFVALNRGASSSPNGGAIFSLYIDNLPNGVGLPWFRKFFSNFGSVVDAYLPFKRSKRTGNRFGFIRYDSIRGMEFAKEKANGFWIGKKNLIVEKATYDREAPQQISKPRFELNYGGFRGSRAQGQNRAFDGKDMGYGKELKDVEKRFSLNLNPVAVDWLTKSAVAKLKALTTPELVQNALRELNFNDVSVKSLGGMKIIITFQSRDDRTNALTNPIIVNWFKLIKPWNGEVAGESRIIWLKCRGMPLTVWNVASFKRMGEIWGEFITLDVETMKEESYDVGRLMIATEQPQRIEEWINITVRGKIHKVKVWEEDCDDIFNEKPISDWVNKQHDELRVLHDSDHAKVNDEVDKQHDEPSLSKNVREKVVAKNTLGINKEGDQDQDRLKDDVEGDVDAVNHQLENVLEPSADVGSKYGSQHHDSCSEEVANSKIEADMPPIFNEEAIVMDSINSSLGTQNSVAESEIVADSLEKISMEYQPQSNNEEHLDHFEANQVPIQAAIKGIKGKRNRKSIDEILGYSKVNARNTNGKRNNKKCVVLRSAVASAALSASISSGGINNRNKILLDEAQAIWAVDKLFGISYDGEEEEVVSKIAEMEALNKARAGDQL